MKVLEFKYFDSSDKSVDSYFDGHCWSRPYEYKKVEDSLKEHIAEESKVHNTSWGFAGPHVMFKETLDGMPFENLHTDLRPSNLENTDVYDITQQPKEEWVEAFDAVINISTVEEVRFDHVKIIQNLLSMVKPEGYLLITFDLPGLQLQNVEEMVGQKIEDCESRLSGASSKYQNKKYSALNCGFLFIKK